MARHGRARLRRGTAMRGEVIQSVAVAQKARQCMAKASGTISMGKLVRVHCKSREEWLDCRSSQGIGASEAAVVAGVSSFMTVNELWNIKTGKASLKDLSDNEFVSKGVRMEPALRVLYKTIHPEYKISHHPYDMLYQKEHPFIFATLDGEISDGERKGILEIKTSTPNGKAGWDNWNEQVPQGYYVQICHQLNATGFDFAVLFAALFGREGDMVIREYRFEREDCLDDMKWLLEKAESFWQSVQTETIPPTTILF